ncbi:unnamed protein product, partial [Prorocentrum cordatum]
AVERHKQNIENYQTAATEAEGILERKKNTLELEIEQFSTSQDRVKELTKEHDQQLALSMSA